MPVIPIAMDAYRQWDKWPQQRIGARAYMRSTYDRTGGGSDAGNFLFMNQHDHNVTLDLAGSGVFYFFRTNHWHGSPWHFVVDGQDYTVSETATANPVDAKKNITKSSFIPANAFPQPLCWTWEITKGSDLIWTPMPFNDSFRIAYARTCYGTGYYIYHLYSNKNNLSQPINSWNMNTAPDADVIELLNRSGTDIAPQNISVKRGTLKLNNEQLLIANINRKSSVVRALKFVIPMAKAEALEQLRLQVTWDERATPSIDVPLSLFFGAGTFYNRENKEYLVKGFPINVRFDYQKQVVELACYYPMPFFRSAKFELNEIVPSGTEISYEIRYEPLQMPIHQSSYFHATYKDIPKPEMGRELCFLDTKGIEGVDNWSGSFVGTSFIFSHQANLYTLEGDPRFFFDDSKTPQAQGTGTEEWCGGGDYWGGENMTLPLAGHPCGASEKGKAKNEKDLIQSAYRFLLADLMPFGKRAVITFEHSENVSQDHYKAVTYWYGLPAASLIKTDSLDVGDIPAEQAHHYNAPAASKVDTITSRYEWGQHTFPGGAWGYDVRKVPGYAEKIGKEIFPAHSEYGRYHRDVSEFTIRVDPKNVGVLLRRTLDYSFPNQRAEVFVAPVHPGSKETGAWEKIGIWYLAGSNTCMYSRPPGELDARTHIVKTSNRRFRDDEFLIPEHISKGQSYLRIRIRFLPGNQMLYPGHPFPKETAWSELKYDVFSYVIPYYKP